MDVQTEAAKDGYRVTALIAVAELTLKAGPIVYFMMLLPRYMNRIKVKGPKAPLRAWLY